jgi:CRP-like cAMP-binding protein
MDAAELSAFDIFGELSDEDRTTCAGLFTEQRVLMGEALTQKDDFGYSFFLVLDGDFKVTVEGEEVARLGAGDHFGEMALVRGDRRNATVTATETGRVAKMMTWDFNELIEQHPSVAQCIQAVVAERGS